MHLHIAAYSVVTGGTTTATYTYDGDGYRTKKVVGATTTIYAWDRLGLGGLGTIIGAGTAEQVFGPAGLQQRTVGTASQYAQGDGLGSVRLVTDASGVAAGTATYEPWGVPRAGSSNLGGFGYTGELTDAETGFVYLRARYMDPASGRFMTEDSYPGALDSPISQHRLAYGHDNPTNLNDPSGHCPICLVIPAGAAAAIVALLPIITAAGISMAIVYSCAKIAECREAVEWLAQQVRNGVLCGQQAIDELWNILESRGKDFKGGSQRQRDKTFGVGDKAFWEWWHRVGKPQYGGYDIESKEEALEIYQEWIEQGRPSAPKGRYGSPSKSPEPSADPIDGDESGVLDGN